MSVAAQPAPILAFDAASHVYTLDGVRLPSVTQALESVGLVDYTFIPPRTRIMALERGRAVHEAIALDLEGDLDEDSVAELMPYVEAARAARRHYGIERPDAWEYASYHDRFRYAGTLDLKCRELIIDWKTNKAEHWVRYQLAAYAAWFNEPTAIRRMCVELHDDATFTPYVFPAREFRSDFGVFLAALQVYNAKAYPKELPR